MYKKVVAALAMIFAMLFVSIGAFAASPAVQEVEALISQIGTVTEVRLKVRSMLIISLMKLPRRQSRIMLFWQRHSRCSGLRMRWQNWV